MCGSIFKKYGAIFVVVASVAWPVTAKAQLAVNDAAANATLSTISSTLTAMFAEMQKQTALLTTIDTSNSAILAALCTRSVIGSTASGLIPNDAQNIVSTGVQLFDGGLLPEGFKLPSVGNVADLQRGLRKAMGLGNDVKRAAQRAKDLVDNPGRAVERAKSAVTAKVLGQIRLARQQAWTEAVNKTMAFSAYSLGEGASAKARESTLDVARRNADCLREDVNANNRTMLEVLSRLNHMNTLMANDHLLQGTTALQQAVVWVEPDEKSQQ